MASIRETFDKRTEYHSINNNFNLPNSGSLYTKYYLDIWSISPFYGKVDTLGVPVIPKLSSLGYCSYAKDNEQYKALTPAINFFFGLRKEYEEYYNLNAFNKNSKFYKKNLPPKRALIDSNIQFANYLNTLKAKFTEYVINSNKENILKTYDDFINELLYYIQKNNLYLTRAGFVESYDFSTLHTGLAFDIFIGDGNNDDLRLEFFNDINSEAFLELCIRNNLKIDREVPWRVIADIRTKGSNDEISFYSVMKEYIPNYNGDLQKFFDRFYDRVIPYDINSYAYFIEFIGTLFGIYIDFTTTLPFYKTFLIDNCGKAVVNHILRQTLNENLLSFDREKYLDLYLKFRNVELSRVIPKEKLEHYSQIAVDMYKFEVKNKFDKTPIINAIKNYTNNIGTLAYRYPSLYELDEKSKMP